MFILILGLILFLGVHSVSIVAPNWRNAVGAKIGEHPWKGIYSVVALVGLLLIIYGYDVARQQPVYLYVSPGFFAISPCF